MPDPEVGGIARMNIAAMDDETLIALRRLFASEAGDEVARVHLAAVDDEIGLRGREADAGMAPAIPGGFCSLCGNTNLADLGEVIGICLDKAACHERKPQEG